MAELLKNSIITAEITGYSSSGDGISKIDGRVVFVKNALRGEHCRIKILKVNASAVYAKIEAVISPSPERLEPACSSFSKCGGCHLMHMTYEEELWMKRQRVEDSIRRIGGIHDVPVDPIIGAESISGYRNKVIYAVGGTAGNPLIGFYRSRSHDIIPIKSCDIGPEPAKAIADAVLRWMKDNNIEPYDERSHSGLIRHIFIRHGFKTAQTALCIVANTKKLPKTGALIDEITLSCDTVKSIVLNSNITRGNTVLSGKFTTLWGAVAIEDMLCGLKFILSPRSFYQINRDQAEKLYEKVLELAALSGEETVLDLYCGTGTITLYLARHAKSAVGAEIVPEAVADARRNAEINGVNNVRFISADASQAAVELEKEGLTPDVIVVDPPRKGLARDVIETICRMSPERAVYVSCDPATLARDLKVFSELNYMPSRIIPLDMFPRCAHVETVVLLSHRDFHNKNHDVNEAGRFCRPQLILRDKK